MDVRFDATYLDGHDSRPHPAVGRLVRDQLEIELTERHGLDRYRRFERNEVKIGSRLANTPRTLSLPNDAKLETEDNDAVDRIAALWGVGKLRPHLLESSLPLAIAATLVVGLGSFAAFHWGVPWAAKHLAHAMPKDVAYELGEGTLEALDRMMFDPSELPESRQLGLRERFDQMASHYAALPLKLEFRKAGMPNAFALPDGTIIMTDELVRLSKRDEEIFAVLAHEIGHIEHRHAARMAIESSAVGLVATFVLGDASQVAGIVGSLPAIYANAHFSRDHETEADLFALAYMRKVGLDPTAFADVLGRMTEHAGGDGPAVFQYVSSHPPTEERIARFSNAR